MRSIIRYFVISRIKTSDYIVGYATNLTLKITITREGVSAKQAVEQVREWVKSKGMDPNTHQYRVENDL